jgi:mRNA-decapping enzyme subunit 2
MLSVRDLIFCVVLLVTRRSTNRTRAMATPTGDHDETGADAHNEAITSHSLPLTLEEALEDVQTRFILNAPESELRSTDRLFFQLEQAWWFYEDCICDKETETSGSTPLPRFGHMKPFALKLFEYSEILPDPIADFPRMWKEFIMYKQKISNYGCILLSDDYSSVVLCQDYHSLSWTFPAGKVNQGEDGIAAAARETYEETSFDPNALHGETASWYKQQDKQSLVTWTVPLQEEDAIRYTDESNGKHRTCYVCYGVPMDFPFAPISRKEVSSVKFFPLNDLPKKHYALAPFLPRLKRWIAQHKKRRSAALEPQLLTPAAATTAAKRKASKKSKGQRSGSVGSSFSQASSAASSSARKNSRGRRGTPDGFRSGTVDDNRYSDLIQSGLAHKGEVAGWSEEDMFATNARLIGRTIDYDGNPHVFAERGFDIAKSIGGQTERIDPHAYRIVGGTLLNSASASPRSPLAGTVERAGLLASSQTPFLEQSRLQPLFNSRSNEDENDGDGPFLQPFFSPDGVTPWGEVVPLASAASSETLPLTTRGKNINTKPTGDFAKEKRRAKNTKLLEQQEGDSSFVLPTDAEITAQSQAAKLKSCKLGNTREFTGGDREEDSYYKKILNIQKQRRVQYMDDVAFIQRWVANLPVLKPTKYFGAPIKLDADELLRGTPLDPDFANRKGQARLEVNGPTRMHG